MGVLLRFCIESYKDLHTICIRTSACVCCVSVQSGGSPHLRRSVYLANVAVYSVSGRCDFEQINSIRHLHIHLQECVGMLCSLTFSGDAVMFVVFSRVTPAVLSYQGRSGCLELSCVPDRGGTFFFITIIIIFYLFIFYTNYIAGN